jgi:hypothetical protein
MAKRFTDTEKWKKPFIRGLQGPYKLLWLYICDDCDHAGIWQVDMDVAQIRIGEKIDLKEAITSFDEKIIIFDKGNKWFIPSFLEFQYPSGLNSDNRAHNSVIILLEKYNLRISKNKPFISPLEGAMDMDKVMDKDKDKDKVELKLKKNEIPKIEEFLTYCKEFIVNDMKESYEEYEFSLKAKYQTWVESDWKDGYNKPIKTWKSKIKNTFPHLKKMPINKNFESKKDNSHLYQDEDFLQYKKMAEQLNK